MASALDLLGYAPDERVLIIHADDVGFSHASNVAVFEGMISGSLTCASALVAAPWFAETAKLQAAHPDADIGVHMALTAEYETYRWRSLTGDPAPHAPDGGMWRDVASVMAHVSPDVARAELRAQIDHALAMGVDVTHLDTHMGTVMQAAYLPAYVDLAVEYRLPVFMMTPSERALATGDGRALAHAEQAARLDALGWPLLDRMIHRTLSEIAPDDKERTFREIFASLRPGLTHFLVHPAAGGDELDAMTPVDCAHRAREHELFRGPELREYCESIGIRLTGYRAIRDALRARLGAKAGA